MNKVQANRNRILIENAKTLFPGSRPTLSYLKAVIVLKNNSNVYQVTFNQFESSEGVGEKKLGQNDGFVVDKLGFFLGSRNASEAGTERLITYPDIQVFPNVTNAANLAPSSPASFKNSHLMAIYNGQYKINLAGTDVFESLDMMRHLHVPEIQDQALPAHTDEEAGFLRIEPYMVLKGNKKHYIEVKLPLIANQLIEAVRQTTGTSDKEHILVAYAHGALINSNTTK